MQRGVDRSVSLAGEWEFRAGEGGQWQTLRVPGCWEQAGVAHDWEGPAYLRRRVTVPEAWRDMPGQRLWLRFDAVSYACQIRVNQKEVGQHIGAWDRFVLEITDAVRGCPEFELLVRIVKPGGTTYPTPQTTAGFLPYVWGYLFGGIWQDVFLERTGPVRLPGYPVVTEWRSGEGTIAIDSLPAVAGTQLRVALHSMRAGEREPAPVQEENTSKERRVFRYAGIRSWSPEAPERYRVRVEISCDGEVSDAAEVVTGFREVTVQGSTPLLNGRPFYPRMVLSWGWYPETLHCNPPVAAWQRELEQVRTLGYNGVKCCLWVPPEEFLNLCDAMGILVWLELPLWLPNMNAGQWQQAAGEYVRVVQQVRHHPCVVLWTLGCELSTTCPEPFLRTMYDTVKALTGSPLVRDNSGGGECYEGALEENADFQDFHFYCDLPFLRPTFDYFLPRWRPAQPWFFGEFCDADAFRDLEAIRNDNAGVLPWWCSQDPRRNPQGVRWDMNVTRLWERMEAHGLWARREELKTGQRKQTLLHRKFTVELVRSYREMSGYVITGIRDTPITTSGMVDDLDALRYTPEEFLRFNADTVLFLGWHRRRQWKAGGDRPSYIDPWCHFAGEALLIRIGIAHHGADTRVVSARYALIPASSPDCPADAGAVEVTASALPAGDVRQLGLIRIIAPDVHVMTRYELRVRVALESGGSVENVWPLWFAPRPDWSVLPEWYACDPAQKLTGLEAHGGRWHDVSAGVVADLPAGSVLVATRWVEPIASFVRRGGQAVVFVETGDGLPVQSCPFWREAMKLFEPHLVWRAFPHEGFTDLHFYGLGPDCVLLPGALQEQFPDATWRPVLRRVDARTYAVTDYLTEAVFPSGGRLLASTLRPHGGLGDQPDGLLRHTAGVCLLVAVLSALSEKEAI
ncbi:MAG: glycoside hydrolase family 2 TIM barrel-domain containing protein [Chloroherpetonaceae bacterium]|nr:hypothetical protein [Chthonomonadaceae bacterium]MDW8207136.1 glycoside hydrolase family 2 TIM barrel-domain containing protein [Chloroherpetonaceae bacterium]